jgi:Amt family ammonium transporter
MNGADPTLPLEAYNNTLATGGDSRVDNLNVYYNVSLLCWGFGKTWG